VAPFEAATSAVVTWRRSIITLPETILTVTFLQLSSAADQ
jgi:hypothetical protein